METARTVRRVLHIIAACADRKRVSPPAKNCLRWHRSAARKDRLGSFTKALEQARGSPTPARDLYVGPYWATIRDLSALAADVGLKGHLWVASAGYGLIPGNAPICAYSATFQTGAPDSVATTDSEHAVRVQLAAWWNALAAWPGPVPGSFRRIADLAAHDPKAAFLVIASPRYLQAMESDLGSAARRLGDRLVIVSSATRESVGMLGDNVVPSEAPLRAVVGGALPALHARVARHVIAESRKYGLRASVLRERYRRLIDGSNFRAAPKRTPMADEQVVDFVKRAVIAAPDLKCSPALRLLRGSGQACEQKRFKRLFEGVVSHHVQ